MGMKVISLQYKVEGTDEWIDSTVKEHKGLDIEKSFIKAKVRETEEFVEVIPMINHDGIFLNLFHDALDEDNDIIYKPFELEFDSESYKNFPWEIWGRYIPQERIEILKQKKL